MNIPKYLKTTFIVLLLIIEIFLFFSFLFGKQGFGRVIDKIGISDNSFDIQIDKELQKDLFIYWFGETEFTNDSIKNKLLIYHRNLQADIIDSYGPNRFLIQYKELSFDKIGVWKTYAYAKHKYFIKIRKEQKKLIFEWKISNWYEMVINGNDTVELRN
jgi:hypothetical protein